MIDNSKIKMLLMLVISGHFNVQQVIGKPKTRDHSIHPRTCTDHVFVMLPSTKHRLLPLTVSRYTDLTGSPVTRKLNNHQINSSTPTLTITK